MTSLSLDRDCVDVMIVRSSSAGHHGHHVLTSPDLCGMMSFSGRSLLPVRVDVLLSPRPVKLCRLRCCSSTLRSNQTAGNTSALVSHTCLSQSQRLTDDVILLILSSSGGRASPKVWAGCNSRSSPDDRNGGVQASTSPLHLPSCSPSLLSLSPIESPLTVGSFLEQRAWELFRPTNQNEPEESQGGLELPKETKLQLESPPLGQEVEEPLLLIRSPSPELHTQSGTTPPPADMLLAGHLRRHDLSIMDYDETMVMPEF